MTTTTKTKTENIGTIELRIQARAKKAKLEEQAEAKATREAERRERLKTEMIKQANAAVRAARVTKAKPKTTKKFDVQVHNRKQLMRDDGALKARANMAMSADAITIDDDDEYDGPVSKGPQMSSDGAARFTEDIFDGGQSPAYESMHSCPRAPSHAIHAPSFEPQRPKATGPQSQRFYMTHPLDGIRFLTHDFASCPCPQFSAGHLAGRGLRGTWKRCLPFVDGKNIVGGCGAFIMEENAYQQGITSKSMDSQMSPKEWDALLREHFSEEELLVLELFKAMK